MLDMGVDLKTVSDYAGHSTIVMTGDRYGHVTDEMDTRAADSFDKAMGMDI
jgi:integrase